MADVTDQNTSGISTEKDSKEKDQKKEKEDKKKETIKKEKEEKKVEERKEEKKVKSDEGDKKPDENQKLTLKEKKGKHKKVKKAVEKKEEDKKEEKAKDKKKKSMRRVVKRGLIPKKGKKKKESNGVSIDWETEEGNFETVFDEKQLRFNELEAQISDLKRENMNLINEIRHMKPDLDKKTNLLEVYDNRISKFKEDFEKYKLRNMREKRSSMKYASEKLLLNLIEVMDNMDRAVRSTKPEDTADSVVKALKQIKKQMSEALLKEGVKPMDAVNKPFNPKFHEAMLQEKDDSVPDGTILEEIFKGYKYKDKTLRIAKVKVSQSDVNPAVKMEESEDEEDAKEVEKEKSFKKAKKKEKKHLKRKIKESKIKKDEGKLKKKVIKGKEEAKKK